MLLSSADCALAIGKLLKDEYEEQDVDDGEDKYEDGDEGVDKDEDENQDCDGNVDNW